MDLVRTDKDTRPLSFSDVQTVSPRYNRGLPARNFKNKRRSSNDLEVSVDGFIISQVTQIITELQSEG